MLGQLRRAIECKYPIRKETVTEHGTTMARQVDGREHKLKQNFQIHAGKVLVFTDGWEMDIRSSYDNVLNAMDVHGHRLSDEFKEICQQAAFYHVIKGGMDDDSQKMLWCTFSRIGALGVRFCYRCSVSALLCGEVNPSGGVR